MIDWMRTCDGATLPEAGVALLIKREMRTAKTLRIRGVRPADPLAFWRRMGEMFGPNADIIEDSVTGELHAAGGRWMDVRFEPDRADSYRHHNVGQPLHCDNAYHPADQAARLALFYLERQAEAGGESLFVDAETVAAYARSEAPDLHAALISLPIQFGKAGGETRVERVLSRSSGRLKINWNYYRVLPGQGEAVDRVRHEFAELLQRLVQDGCAQSFRLQAGDAVFFRDDEVLHGRKAYAARESGDRLLWKTYFHVPADFGAAASARAA
jgi:alpha-ketoglutarate-dependent taurine dioxygenase